MLLVVILILHKYVIYHSVEEKWLMKLKKFALMDKTVVVSMDRVMLVYTDCLFITLRKKLCNKKNFRKSHLQQKQEKVNSKIFC